MRQPLAVRPGDRVRFDGRVHIVVGIGGVLVRLADEHGQVTAAHLPTLMMLPGFALLGSAGPVPRLSPGLLDGVEPGAARQALWWHRHIAEVLTGLPPDAPAGAAPDPRYDPRSRTLTQREAAKAQELSEETGRTVSPHTVRWRRRRYQSRGVLGMLDGHRAPRRTVAGQVDPRVVDALRGLMGKAADGSTRTVSYYFVKVGQAVAGLDDAPTMPSRATFYRLFDRLEAGRHTTGSARTRRSLANQPDGVFDQVAVCRPGELMEIDSTPFDVLVRLGDGVAGRVELTGLVDIATRTIAAAVLRPTTRSVDAALLLARAVTPATMRPGWSEALRMEYSALPYHRMLSVDERLRHAAAVPLIIPEAIVVDGGKAFLSRNFHAACNALGTEVVHAPVRDPCHKPHIERTLGAAASLFAQFLAGYTGRSAEHRGRNVEADPLWSLPELQELLQEWIVSWQNRPHDALRDPLAPGRTFTPNEKYAALVESAGYLPLPLSPQDYLELLPTRWQAVNSYGIKIDHRIYNCEELNGLRRVKSGLAAHGNRWEVRHDPYDIRLVWLRDHREGTWITVPWRLLSSVATPFGQMAWDHSVRAVREAGEPVTEDAVAKATLDLLERGGAGPATQQPAARAQRTRSAVVAARTRAAGPSQWPRPWPEPSAAAAADAGRQDPEPEKELAQVIPLKIFDARQEAKRWW